MVKENMIQQIALCSILLALLLVSSAVCAEPYSAEIEEENKLSPALLDSEVPTPRSALMMAYDQESDVTILFGGYDSTYGVAGERPDWWSYDYNTDTYTNLTTASGPGHRSVASMVYDSESDRIILFGGVNLDQVITDETWAYDYNLNNWQELNPATSPGSRATHLAAYDSESDRIVLFGGVRNDRSTTNETWAFDVNMNTWEQMNPSVAPNVQHWYSLAYDIESDRIILFGGRSFLGPGTDEIFGETWSYDYNTDTWEQLSPSTSPETRLMHFMVYDNESDTIVMFGGLNAAENALLDDTWHFDYNTVTWTQAINDTHPTARKGHTMVYDFESDRIVLFGGAIGEVFGNLTNLEIGLAWFYDTNSNGWTAGDSDQDGLLDSVENSIGTNPFNIDTESDGMPDGWEYNNGLDPLVDDSEDDPDSDLLENLDEFLNSADPQDDDTDSDGLLDGLEVHVHHTYPSISDTDADGMPDGWEVSNELDPLVDDADDDDDGDTLANSLEYMIGTDPQSEDTDGDGMNDGWERLYNLDPTDPADGPIDEELDGLSNRQEHDAGSHPRLSDSDGDGYSDLWEVTWGFNPADGNVPLTQPIVFYSPIIAGGVLIVLFVILGLRYRQRKSLRSIEERYKEEEERERKSIEELMEYTNGRDEDPTEK